MSIIPTRAAASDTGQPRAVRRSASAFGTMAGIGVLAGLSSAVLALIGQARSATRSIEALAVEAALADGTLVPPAVPGGSRAQQRLADHLVHVRLPQGDGVYRADGALHRRLASGVTADPGRLGRPSADAGHVGGFDVGRLRHPIRGRTARRHPGPRRRRGD